MEQKKSLSDFKKEIKKVYGEKKFKISGSLGVYDAYKYIRKNKWFNIGKPISESLFYSIIRKMNKKFADAFVKGYDIVFPNRMGTIELRKWEPSYKIVNGKIKASFKVDWDKTIKLWYEDEEAYKNRTLIKMQEEEIFKIIYNRVKADYTNKTFMYFTPVRDLKLRIKEKIKNKEIDAFKF
jgi:hypothetical protein